MTSLTFDPRLYDLMRQNAITTVEEALVELITNSHDAYTSAEKLSENTNLSNLPIYIELKENILTVKDDAKGMTSEEMQKKLLTVGSLTADEFTRGLIGRGAKDISNLGNITFVAIKDNKISQCNIYTDLTGDITIKDEPVTQEQREKYKMLGNGMMVKVMLSDMVEIPDITELTRRMKNNYFLRKIYTESDHPVTLNGQRIIYQFPVGQEVLSVDFEIPGYPEAKANFKLFKSKEVIPNPTTDLELRYGVLVASSKSVYECGGLYAHNTLFSSDYRWNPNLKMVYGELTCDYIDKLARDISTVGKTLDNPFLIFDPNRRNGLHKKHPFTIALFETPYRWLEIILNKIQDEKDQFMLTGEDIGEMLHSIESLLQQNLPLETTLYTWRSKSDQENLNSMVGKITDLKINSDIVNIDQNIVDQILKGDKLVPVSTTSSKNFKFDIKITDNKEMTKPFDVYFYSDKISIRINARDETIEPFVTFEEENNKVDIEGEGAMVAVNRVLQDAIVYMMTRQTLMSSVTPTVSDTNNLNEILEIQSNAKQNLKSYSYSIFKSIYDKYHSE